MGRLNQLHRVNENLSMLCVQATVKNHPALVQYVFITLDKNDKIVDQQWFFSEEAAITAMSHSISRAAASVEYLLADI